MSEEITDKQTQWLLAIDEAKGLLKSRLQNQMLVAEKACAVCEITRGGAGVNTRYTIKAFAKAIKLNPKTLSNWIFVYRGIYLRLPKPLQEKASYTKLSSVSHRINSTTSRDKLAALVQEEFGKTKMDSLVWSYLGDLRALVFNMKKDQIWNCNKKTLEEMHYWIAQASSELRRLRKVKAIDCVCHELVALSSSSHSPKKAFELDAQFASHETGKVKLNTNDKKGYAFIKTSPKKAFTPTRLGEILFEGSKTAKKLKALRVLTKLHSLDLVTKTDDGAYRAR